MTRTDMDDYVNAQLLKHKVIEERQEELLDDMQGAVNRLTDMSRAINSELGVHTVMLSELSNNVDDANDRFSLMERRVDRLLNRTGWSHWKVIFWLTFIALVLLFLIMYT